MIKRFRQLDKIDQRLILGFFIILAVANYYGVVLGGV